MVLDRGSETQLMVGNLFAQRGTNHLWHNHSGKPCRIAFVLVDATLVDPGGVQLDKNYD